ncbi:C40 family peptidase [Salmonella enterica]
MKDTVRQAVFDHVQAAYPNEACGLICRRGRWTRYFPCTNLSGSPQDNFALCPQDYARAEDWGDVVAVVHSHPDATSLPSDADRATCNEQGVPWLIVSWPEGDVHELLPVDPPLIGRPFVLGVYDCWGLIMSYYRQEYGITLTDYRVDYPWWESGLENRYVDNQPASGFVPFDGDPRPGDIVLMQISAPVVNHAGVLLDGGVMLHHLYGHQSGRTPYGGFWRDRTWKILRHKDLL